MRGFSRGSIDICARDSIWKTPIVSARWTCRRRPGPRAGCPAQRERPPVEALHEIERAADAGEHAERQHVDLEQAQRVEVVLVPLDHGAIGHRGVLDRHQAREPPRVDHEAARVLREVARKADQLLRQLEHDLCDDAVVGGRSPPSSERARASLRGRPTTTWTSRSRSTWSSDRPSALPTSRSALARLVGDDAAAMRGALAPVLPVDVLDHLLAPLVLEVDVDVGRLVALLAR